MSILPMRPLGFGEVLDGAIQLYRRDFWRYYLIGLIATFASFLMGAFIDVSTLMEALAAMTIMSESEEPDFQTMASILSDLVPVFLAGLVSSLLTWYSVLATTAAMADRVEGGSVNVGRAFVTALERTPSALGATLTIIVAGLVVMVVFGLFAFLVTAILAGTGTVGVIAVVVIVVIGMAIGLLMTMLGAGLSVAVLPPVVVEKCGPFAAIGRLFSLARGSWLKVIGVMVVSLVVLWLVTTAASLFTGLPVIFSTPEDYDIGPLQWALANAAAYVVTPLALPFLAGGFLVLFHDLRVRSEGFDIEMMAGSIASRDER